MNIKLLKQIQREIIAEPLRFDMTSWADTKSSVPKCGTTCCIAGWACSIDFANKNPGLTWSERGKLVEEMDCCPPNMDDWNAEPVAKRAAELIGLPEDFVTDTLFHWDFWPSPFDDQFEELMQQMEDVDPDDSEKEKELLKKMAMVAVNRIAHLIATGE